MKNKKEKTNLQMYKEIAVLFDNKPELEYDEINKIFGLEKRTELDLYNLRDFIIAVAMDTRRNLMTMLLQTIDSVICTLD